MKSTILNPVSRVLLLLLIVGSLGFNACNYHNSQSSVNEDVSEINIDLEQIKHRGVLRAVTAYSPTSYYIYRGRPMGFQYEMMEKLAAYLDVELELSVVDDIDVMIDMLHCGEIDIIAHDLRVTKSQKEVIGFAEHYSSTKLVLVQKKRRPGARIKPIRNIFELAGKDVFVSSRTNHINALEHLSEVIGEDIMIWEANDDLKEGDLITAVSKGEIEYAITDFDLAKLYSSSYRNVDFYTELSFDQKIAWGVRKNSDDFQEVLNEWITKYKKGSSFAILLNKYYQNKYAFQKKYASTYLTYNSKDRISPYDDLIKKEAKVLNWDWRLIASLVYQESHFNPKAESFAGAIGLMQVLPTTASNYTISQLKDPKINVRVGIRYLKWLNSKWEPMIEDPQERLKFILGSYNAGIGHVLDARALAVKYGKDPDIWDNNVAFYLKQKSKKEFYKDPVVKHGYCRGSEPFKYVSSILNRYENHYRTIGGSEVIAAGI